MFYEYMKTFLEVANCLSFSQAARRLFISQQAVTKHIASLEKQLGIKLFYRTTRRVELTPAGMSLRDDFLQINQQIHDSIYRAKSLASSGKSYLRLGFLSSLSRKDIILPVTDYLMKNYPNLEIQVQLFDFIDLRNHLLDGKLDFCITTSSDWMLWPNVRTTVLQKKQFQAVYSRRHPLSACREITLEDFSGYTQLILPNDNQLKGIEEWGKKIPCRRSIYCPDISTLMVRLELGDGFALLTKVIEGHDSENLKYWDVPFPEAHAEVVCICAKNASDQIQQMIADIRASGIVKV